MDIFGGGGTSKSGFVSSSLPLKAEEPGIRDFISFRLAALAANVSNDIKKI